MCHRILCELREYVERTFILLQPQLTYLCAISLLTDTSSSVFALCSLQQLSCVLPLGLFSMVASEAESSPMGRPYATAVMRATSLLVFPSANARLSVFGLTHNLDAQVGTCNGFARTELLHIG